MKLRNKKTGEIKDVESLGHEKSLRDKYGPQITLSWNTEYENLGECKTYNSLAELNDDWEDASEEPKDYYCIDWTGGVNHITLLDGVDEYEENKKEIGNYFNTREEAEKVVEKLKAWKRLKDKGFKFVGFNRVNDCASLIRATFDEGWSEIYDDLNTCFGGEE